MPPPSPTTRSVSSANGTNTVAWTAVGKYLGGPVTGYEVQYNADDTGSYPDASWEAVPECVVLDAGKRSCTHGTPSGYLDKGDKYKYRVRARNAVGRGGWSLPSAEVVVTAGIPTSVDLGVRSSNGENTVRWEFARNGGDIVEYQAQYSEVGKEADGSFDVPECASLSGGLRTCVHSGAVLGKSYRYRVRARNSEGWGQWEESSPVYTIAAGGMVSAGSQHTCAVRSEGEVRCWGAGNYGRLGDGSATSRTAPVAVIAGAGRTDPLQNVVQVTPGTTHTCALLSGGGVRCWGHGNNGYLGDGSTSGSTTPVAVVAGDGTTDPLQDVVQISAGSYHTCALLPGGGVRCWGAGGRGRLGDGSTTGRTAPVAVVAGDGTTDALQDAVQVAAGLSHTCALLSGGGVRCWGAGGNGRLGDGSTTDRTAPVAVVSGDGTTESLQDAVQVAAGGKHSCALLSGGEVRCWG